MKVNHEKLAIIIAMIVIGTIATVGFVKNLIGVLKYDPDFKCPEELPAPVECARNVLLNDGQIPRIAVEACASDEQCVRSGALNDLHKGLHPYCDLVNEEYMQNGGICHDRFDVSESTGIATCNDGTHQKNPLDCTTTTTNTATTDLGSLIILNRPYELAR